ncbi:hypothetical protein GJQ54_05145 [Oceanospirillaceae bacterium ASx5O]|nr:hypothetical protein GJQ54_05145 [Oceanospirillaceae bacterium ASx5O]
MNCIAANCDRQAVALSMCKMHWKRNKCGHDINKKSAHQMTVTERFFERVEKSSEGGCWVWVGSKRGSPRIKYGSFWNGKKHVAAHRFSWEMVNGEIPEGGDVRGMCVCHHCDNPLCVNPAHLFLGTHKDNMQDKVRKQRGTGSKAQCSRGHARNSANTYVSKSGIKHCRICHKIKERNRRARLKASGG